MYCDTEETAISNSKDLEARNARSVSELIALLSATKIGAFSNEACDNAPLQPEDAIAAYLERNKDSALRDLEANNFETLAKNITRALRADSFLATRFNRQNGATPSQRADVIIPANLAHLIPTERSSGRPQKMDAIEFLTKYWAAAISAGATQQLVNAIDPPLLEQVHKRVKDLKAARQPVPKFKWPKIQRTRLDNTLADINSPEAQAFLERRRANSRAQSAAYRARKRSIKPT